MLQQLKQVAITYSTRRIYWILGVPAILMAAPLWVLLFSVLLKSRISEDADTVILSVAILSSVVAVLCALHAKQQFAHSRARLMPGFTWPHLAIAIGAIAVGAFVMPLLVAAASTSHPLPITCWVSCLVAALVWSVYFNSGPAMFLAMGIGYGAMWPPARVFWGLSNNPPMTSPPVYLWPLLAGAWAAIICWLVRLATLHEEQDEYESSFQISIWDKSPRAVRLQGRQFGVLQRKKSWWINSWLIDRWHDQISRRHEQGTLSRSFLYKFGFRAQPDWVMAISMAFFLLVFLSIYQAMGIFGTRQQGSSLRDNPAAVIILLQFSVLMPAILNHTLLMQRWPRLGQEMLASHSREDWIDGLLGTLHRGALLTAAIMQLATLLWVAAWSPQLIGPISVITYLLLIAGCVYLGTAISIWMACRYRSFLGQFLTMLPIMPLIGIFPLWLWRRETITDWPFIIVAALLGFIGWVIMGRARRAWLNVELGGS